MTKILHIEVNTGKMPKAKSEQYVKNIMERHRGSLNKLNESKLDYEAFYSTVTEEPDITMKIIGETPIDKKIFTVMD